MQRHHAKELVTLRCENVHMRECHMSWQPEVNLLERGEVKSNVVGLPKATNLSVCSDTIPLSLNTFEKKKSYSSRTPLCLASWK